MHDIRDDHPRSSDRVHLVGGTASARTPLRGRDDIVRSIVSDLESVMTGGGTTVLVRGTPGIGKTRLLAEALDHAAALGWRTITIVPDVDSGTVPLGALTDAVLRGHTPLLAEQDLAPL